jgi:uncharacterized protein YfeS
MRHLTITTTLIIILSCNQADNSLSKIDFDTSYTKTENVTPLSTKAIQEQYPSLQNAHPKAQALMNEVWFYSSIDDMAPFGSDDAADTYAYFKEWRPNNRKASPKTFVLHHFKRWGYPYVDLETTDYKQIEPFLNQNELGSRFLFGMDAAIISTAFGQLYLEGTIDADIRAFAKTAIQRQLLPEILNKWQDIKVAREKRLREFLDILEKSN